MKCFVKLLEIQNERIVLPSLLICLYTAMNFDLWLNLKKTLLSTHLLVYSTITVDTLYLDDILTVYNPYSLTVVKQLYPNEFTLNKGNITSDSCKFFE